MGNLKKRLSSVLAILFIAMTFLSYVPVRATETIANITFVGVEHSPLIVGDTETFYLSSKGVEKVQYRVFQNKIGTDKWDELTSGYTLPENSNAITTVNSSFKYETGKYQISVWVKKADTEGKYKNKNGSYDSYYVAYLNCVSKDNNNRVYTNGDMNVEKDSYIVGETVKVNGIKDISGMKAPYTYKLHVYDVSNNIWYLDKDAYRDKEDLTWIATKPGTYVLDVWAMSSNSTLWAKEAKLNGRIYEGWKLKVITVKEKEVIPPVIPEPTYNITAVSLDKTTADLTVSESMELSASINPSNATNKKVTWTSSNEAVATVAGSTGTKANVTAKTTGTATITVITEEGQKTATCTITVVEPQTPPPTPNYNVTGVSLDKTTANLDIAGLLELTATINPSNATNKNLIWTSSNGAVATVAGSTGTKANVTAISAGTATITVTTVEGQKTANCEITVTATPIPDTALNATLVVEDYRVTVAVDNIKVANQEITITMHNKADDKLVFIDQLTADSEGKCTFNTSLEAGSYYGLVRAPQASLTTTLDFEIVQTSISVEEVSLDKVTANLTIADLLELTATINPSNATNKSLIWTSSNEAVATVTGTTEANANVIAISAGTATITVTTEEGQKTATCEITVTAAPIPDAALNATLVVEDYRVTVSVDNIKVANQEITITMHNKADDKLVFIDQLTADSEGKCTFNTSLEVGEYYGLVRAPQASLTTILDFEVAEPSIKVKEVSLDKFTANLNIAELLELTATINPDNATNKNVTWLSSNEAIAKVTSSTGTKSNVEALGVGTVAIAVKTEDGGYIAVCIVTVTAAPIPDTELNATLVVEDYRVTVSVDNIKVANQEITITMHNKADDKLVFIDQLTADAEGKCSFNTSLDTGKYYGLVRAPQASLTTTLDFEVVHPNIKVVEVSLDKTTANMTTVKEIELTATINPENATNKKVTWTSSNETVAKVAASGESNATVTAISAGTAIITVTTEDGQKIATCEITVTSTPTSDSELNATVVVIEDKVTASVDNIKVANQEITIVMRNKENNQLVYIGQLTADSEGKCTFNTRLDAGIYYGIVKASLASLITRLDFEVVVTGIKVGAVSLDKTTANMTLGQVIELTATINPENAINKKVTWTSSNEAVATVIGSGEANAAVTAISAGTTIITVTTEDGQKIATCEITVTSLPTSIQSLISQLWLEKIATVRQNTFNERFTLPNFM